MTKTEEAAIRNVIARLKEANCGCSPDTTFNTDVKEIVRIADSIRERDDIHSVNKVVEIVSRIYLDTWIVPALELLLPGKDRDPELARDLAAR